MGFNPSPDYKIQTELYTGVANALPSDAAASDITSTLLGTLHQFGIFNTALETFYATFNQDNPLPKTIDDFVQSIINFMNTNGFATPPIPSSENAILKTAIENSVAQYLLLNNPNPPTNQNFFPDQTTMTQVAATAPLSSQPNLFTDIYDQAFNSFLANFDFNTPTTEGTTPDNVGGVATLNEGYFTQKYTDFFFHLATVTPNQSVVTMPGAVSTGQPMINFQDIYSAFFNNDPTAFQTFLANFINQQVFPASGTGQSFIPSQDVGTWLQQVQQAYSLALKGTGSPLISSVGATTSKVDILDTIFALLVKMIGTLQRVAAAQSQTLLIESNWENAYTTLESEVPVFTAGDGTIFSKYGDTTTQPNARDDANNFNQTLTETIRSRRTEVDNNAKSFQNNLNQSTDSANQQADTATTIIQQLTTLLSAIYR